MNRITSTVLHFMIDAFRSSQGALLFALEPRTINGVQLSQGQVLRTLFCQSLSGCDVFGSNGKAPELVLTIFALALIDHVDWEEIAAFLTTNPGQSTGSTE